VERSGAIGYFDPSYSLYPVLAAIEEIRVKPVPLSPDFAWAMPENYSASLFYLTNPNAPTSLLFPKAKVRAFCKSFRGVVLVDEAYVDFAPGHCVDLALKLPNVLVARTLSKSYSLAGIRLGYAIGSAVLIAALDKIKDSYNVSALTQHIALAALRDQAWMRRNVQRIIATRALVAAALNARGYKVFPSATNFLWVRPAERPAQAVFASLRARNVFVRYFPEKRTGEFLRVTIGTDAQMRAFLGALP
jgi:histidinol-phosphate aminotransferase